MQRRRNGFIVPCSQLLYNGGWFDGSGGYC